MSDINEIQESLSLFGQNTEKPYYVVKHTNELRSLATYDANLNINFKLNSYDGQETTVVVSIGREETKVSMYGDTIHGGETHFYIKATSKEADQFALALSNTVNGHFSN